MNFSRPQGGAGKVKSQGRFRKVLFGICVLLAGLGILTLSAFRRNADRAMSGELVTGLNGQVTESGFISSVFDYFGNVTYLFPLLFVYAVWLTVINYRPLKQVNLFNLGLKLLGVNALILGLCGVCSGLFVPGNTGAGGILGDFINILCFSSCSHYLAAAIPVLLTLLGCMLLFSGSPLKFCEQVGALTFYALTLGRDNSLRGNDREAPSGRGSALEPAPRPLAENTAPAKETAAESALQGASDPQLSPASKPEDAAAAPGSGKLFSAVYTKLSSLGWRHRNTQPQNQPHADLEPSFGDELRAPEESEGTEGNERVEPRVERETAPEFVREVPDFYEGPDRFSPSAKSLSEREPVFESQALRSDLHAYQPESDRYLRAEPFDRQPDGESSYRQVTYPPRYEEEQERSPTHIIREGTDRDSTPSPEREVQNTIITKGSGLRGSFVQSSPKSEEEGISTIITTHPQEPVLPKEEPEAGQVQSTIITRTAPARASEADSEELPADASEVSDFTEEPNLAHALNQEPLSDAMASDLPAASTEDSLKASSPASREQDSLSREVDLSERDALNAGFDTDFESDPQDENIIAFEALNDESSTLEIRDEDLPASFVPSAQGQSYEGLRPNLSPVLSEKAEDYQYLGARRGLSPESDDAQRETETAKPALKAGAAQPDLAPQGEEISAASGDPAAEPVAESPVQPEETSPAASVAAEAGSVIPSELLTSPKPKAVTEFATRDYDHSIISAPETPYGSWRPELSLLRESEGKVEVPYSEISERIARIDRFMQDFKVRAKVAGYVSGPVITLFSLQLEGGISSRQIRSVSTDLTRYLMVKTIRVLDVVPGTQYVGLEVPNATRQSFTLRDVIKEDAYQHTKALLPLCLGVNAIGKPVIADLAKAPHLLIAGTTGSGKSAGINAMLLSLLIKLSPAQLRLILIDPKRIEFSLYGDLPHLITPIIAEPDESAAALNWCVAEMERRYKLIEALGVRQLSEYNRVINEATLKGQQVYDPAWTADMGGRPDVLKPLPYLVIVVDEFADLMAMTGNQKKAEKSPEMLISRLTAKARAAGIHLILATQTPRADIVTGKIKANMPSRVAYTVQSNMESRIILDEQGAESLLGNGDMISRFMGIENYAPFRAHGPFASNDDVNAVVDAWKEHGAPEYIDGVTEVEEDQDPEGGEQGGGEQKLDKLFDQVAAYAREFQAKNNREVSISAIQVQFSIGYTRSKRLMMQLQREGVI